MWSFERLKNEVYSLITRVGILESSSASADASSGGTQYTNVANINSNTTGITINNTGGGGAHNNLQPYIVVYMFKRTA